MTRTYDEPEQVIKWPEPEVIPSEPSHGSVVLDKDGIAWQRIQPDWWSMCGGTSQEPWTTLLQSSGTLTLIHHGGW